MGMEDHQEMGEYVTPNYNTSWDWLMTVIDKIENFIFDENNSYNVTIGSANYCVIQDSNGNTIEIIKDNGNSKLDTTYQAVVEFIKVNKIEVLISKLKSADLDGETTQYILEQIGMDYQMYKQLNVKYKTK